MNLAERCTLATLIAFVAVHVTAGILFEYKGKSDRWFTTRMIAIPAIVWVVALAIMLNA